MSVWSWFEHFLKALRPAIRWRRENGQHVTPQTVTWKCPKGGEFRAWLVRAFFRANSERTPNSNQIPGRFRANSGQILNKHLKPSISLSFCATNLLGWLTTRNTLALGWGETEHARNSALEGTNLRGENANLRFSVGSSGFVRFPAKICGFWQESALPTRSALVSRTS